MVQQKFVRLRLGRLIPCQSLSQCHNVFQTTNGAITLIASFVYCNKITFVLATRFYFVRNVSNVILSGTQRERDRD